MTAAPRFYGSRRSRRVTIRRLRAVAAAGLSAALLTACLAFDHRGDVHLGSANPATVVWPKT